MKPRILLLHADGTQALPFAKSLKKHGYCVDGVFLAKSSYGYFSRFIDKKYIYVGSMKDFERYFAFVNNIVCKEKYESMVPLNDESAELMSKYRSQLLQYCKFIVPDYETFIKGYDKHKLMELCAKQNYPHPKTAIVEGGDLSKTKISNLKFPILIKPNDTCGGRGMTYVENEEKLKVFFPQIYRKFGDCHLQEFIPPGGAQVEVQLYVNEDGELLNSSVIHKFRWYPENGGSSCCNKSVKNNKIVNICHNVLKDLGWIGFADFDTIEDPRTGELLILEINPRMPACVRTAFMSGTDWAEFVINEYLGLPRKENKEFKEIYLRHLGFEGLWFLYSKNRFKTYPNWFKLIGRNIYYQDMCWNDILPFFAGTWGNIKKQMNPEFRKAKDGLR